MARVAATAIGLLLTLSADARAQPAPLEQVLERFFSYMGAYGKAYAATIASEHYRQFDGRRTAVLDSDFGIVRLRGEGPWLGFRDVFAVNGVPVPDRDARLEKLFADAASASGLDRAATIRATDIVRESARFNIGAMQRTINNPAVVLELLDPRHRAAFRFLNAGQDDVQKIRAQKIRFTERARPTIITTNDNRDLPAEGHLWVDPESGRLLRAEVVVRIPFIHILRGTVMLTFKEEPALRMWVPDRMTERYEEVLNSPFLEGEATYSHYRQFRVESLETFRP